MKKLTLKTFLWLLTLSVAISAIAYLCIWISLPDAGERRSQRLFASETEQLVSELRLTEKEESERLFTDFIRKTGADVFLLAGGNNSLSPFTFRSTDENTTDGTRYPFRFHDTDEEYILVVRCNDLHSNEILRVILNSVPFVAAIILVLSFVGARFFSVWTVAPIIRIGKIADRMANLDFSWYCPDMRGDEIGMLSRSINAMSDKLRSALDELNRQNTLLKDEIALEKEREQRRMLFFSGVSHELKTPVAVVIGQIEGMQAGIGVYKDREKYLARSAEILRSLSSFIKEILAVSHLDVSDADKNEAVNVSQEIRTLAEEYSDYAAERSISLSAELEENIIVSGDEKLFGKAFGNIIENAAAHSPDSGNVKICLTKENGAVLTVENSPAHIAEKHLPRLFEAFYRADTSSEQGSGLGLYITRMIFEKYNIGYKIENTADGVRFTVQLHTKNT